MQKTIQQRVYKFDNIKFLAILFVVIGHTISDYVAQDISSTMNGLYLFIYTFHMPLFIFISGLFTKRQENDAQFNINKFTFFIVTGFILKLYRSGMNYILGHKVHLEPIGSSRIEWFMFVMAWFVLAAYLVRKVNPEIVILLSIVFGCLIGFIDFGTISFFFHKQTDFLYLTRFITFSPFFFIGFYLTPEKIMQFTSKIYIKIIFITLTVSYAIFCFADHKLFFYLKKLFTGRNAYSRINIEGCSVQHRLLAYLLASIIIIGIISIVPNIKIPLISSLGKNTLSCYFLHVPILSAMLKLGVMKFFRTLGDPLWTILALLFALALTILFSLDIFMVPFKALQKLISKIPKWIQITGIIVVFTLSYVATLMIPLD